jgi:hypothetical protein
MTTTTETATQETRNGSAKPPVDKLRAGLITASVWQHWTAKGPLYTVTFERRYRDREGVWKTAHSYDAADLAELRIAADLAHARIIELLREQTAA